MIVAFTAENVSRYFVAGRPRVDRIGNCSQGLGSYIIAPATRSVSATADPTPNPTVDVMTLVHELGHVFGAEHVDDINSIMHEDFDYRNRIRRQEPRHHQKNRTCPFAK